MRSESEEDYIRKLSELAAYLSQVIDKLEEHKTNLASEYGSDALEALCNYCQQLTDEFDNHLKYERDPFYRVIRRSERRSTLTKQIAEASLTIAMQLEKYANGEGKYSRATIRRLLSNAIIPIRSLYDFCIEAGGIRSKMPPTLSVHIPQRDTHKAKKAEVNMLVVCKLNSATNDLSGLIDCDSVTHLLKHPQEVSHAWSKARQVEVKTQG